MQAEAIRARIGKLHEDIEKHGLSAAIIMQPENRRYYSGFTGSNGWLLVTPKDRYIITDSRYFHQVSVEAKDYDLVSVAPKASKILLDTLVSILPKIENRGPIGFEKNSMTIGLYESITEKINGFKFAPADEMIEKPRLIKDKWEIQEIKKAVDISSRGFEKMLEKLVEGVTERELAAELEYHMMLSGAKKSSFEAIIASGKNGAFPHARSTHKQIKSGEMVTVDWGALSDTGYCSDTTRTVFIGKPDPEMSKIYNIVRESQEKVLEKLRPGMTTGETDAIARNHISGAGYGDYFGHGLGHGLGLAVHEGPTVKTGDPTVLEPGMVITVEPGIYIPGKGGVRIEDLVLITETGREILTYLPKMDA